MSKENEKFFQFFNYAHLPENLKEVSMKFFELAHDLSFLLPENSEREVCLRKLLEAKDCAVRAKLFNENYAEIPKTKVSENSWQFSGHICPHCGYRMLINFSLYRHECGSNFCNYKDTSHLGGKG